MVLLGSAAACAAALSSASTGLEEFWPEHTRACGACRPAAAPCIAGGYARVPADTCVYPCALCGMQAGGEKLSELEAASVELAKLQVRHMGRQRNPHALLSYCCTAAKLETVAAHSCCPYSSLIP